MTYHEITDIDDQDWIDSNKKPYDYDFWQSKINPEPIELVDGRNEIDGEMVLVIDMENKRMNLENYQPLKYDRPNN